MDTSVINSVSHVSPGGKKYIVIVYFFIFKAKW